MSSIIYPHFRHSIPFSFKPTSLKLHSEQLSFSTRKPIKLVCFSLPEHSYSHPANNRSSSPPTEYNYNEVSVNNPNGSVNECVVETEPKPKTIDKFLDSDPRGADAAAESSLESGIVKDLKRAFVDTVYGSEFGYRASLESQGVALKLVDQLEAANPTPAPTQHPDLLDGNWVLVYTASSELLPLLATGSLPLLKIEKISQSINLTTLTIENSTTISSPVASLSFSVSAAFEVQTPSRIEVLLKEWTFKSPEIKSNIKLPQNLDVFGRNMNFSFLQQSLYPLQKVVARIARSIFGQPRIPIPGDHQPPIRIPITGRRKERLVITYLDNDLRISRADGSLFVLVKEGSPLLEHISR